VRSVLLLAITASAFVSPVLADEGPFLDFSAGWSLPSDISLHTRDNSTPLQGKISAKGAAEVAGELGYAMPDGISGSLEVAHAEYGVGSTTVNGTANHVATGSAAETAVLANVTYRIPYQGRLNWIVGAGAGAAEISPNFTDASGTRTFGNGTGFAWQVLAGANWMLDPVLRLQLDYRYRSVLSTNHSYGTTPVQFGTIGSHSLVLSIRWVFAAPR
jgi:opacity protein-like surface antigen